MRTVKYWRVTSWVFSTHVSEADMSDDYFNQS